MSTPKVKVAIKHIEAAKEAMDKKILAKGDEFRAKNPEPDWDALEAWRKKHPDPRERWYAAREKAVKPLKEKRDKIILEAKMDQMTTEELLKKVREF
jgi:hypothetical protein